MLLIGSRAIAYHFPEFRKPRDWDLIGDDEDIARLDRALPRSERHAQRRDKVHYRLDGVSVEVANASVIPYWAMVSAAFANAPTIEAPVLGPLRIPPPGFLLLTKQCGLIYRVVHWHKNLEDLYFLRDRVPSIPEHVAALLPHTLDDSRRMFAEGHRLGARDAEPCHPAAPGPRDPRLHRELHDRLRLGDIAASLEPRAWDGFPERPAPSRRERMIDLFAEEGMVIAAERRLLSPAIEGELHPEAELTRWALRALITSSMPENLRYFGVNYYREIAARIPRGWMSAIKDMEHLRPACASPGAGGSRCDAEKAPR
ncbi:DUF7277 domain-containing protein [Sorangium sp. So ce1099]|uniref:DUF7277 domain-containing protein n=1 Tax=Sorangium sp. So ce1099 TaxID=3133331 RepID=UPI003F5D966D